MLTFRSEVHSVVTELLSLLSNYDCSASQNSRNYSQSYTSTRVALAIISRLGAVSVVSSVSAVSITVGCSVDSTVSTVSVVSTVTLGTSVEAPAKILKENAEKTR